MITAASSGDSGDKPRANTILRKPAFWIMLTSIALIVAAAIIFLPRILNQKPSNDIPVSAAVYELHMSSPDYAFINTIEANIDILTEEIYKPIQFVEFSGQLGQRFHCESDLYARFESYDAAYFKNKCVFAVILRLTNDKICLFDSVELAQAVNSSDSNALSDLSVNISLTMADNGSEWLEPNSWWLVLIELGPNVSGRAPTDYKLGSVFSGIASEALTQQYKTVMYYTEDDEDLVDRYLVKNYESGEKELCTKAGQPLLSGTDFYPMPHVIGVQKDGGWRLYDKTTLKPVSDRVYEELNCEQYPDDYWSPKRLLAKRGGLWALLDGNGKEQTDALYTEIRVNTYESMWPIIDVVQDGKYGAIGYDGKPLIPTEYTYLTMNIGEDQRTVYVRKDGKWGAITLDDQINASAPDWTAQIPQEISEGYALWECYYHSEDDLFTADAGFKILGSENGGISDQQMAIYASMHMQNYSYETGNTREEYDALTMKYFGKTLTDYTGGGMFEFISGTDRIRAVGWSFDSSMFTMAKSLSKTDGKYYTGQYYCVNISDSFWDDSPYDIAAVKQIIRDENWAPLVEKGLTFEVREVKFTLGQEADGTYYPIYRSVQILQSGLKAPVQ